MKTEKEIREKKKEIEKGLEQALKKGNFIQEVLHKNNLSFIDWCLENEKNHNYCI